MLYLAERSRKLIEQFDGNFTAAINYCHVQTHVMPDDIACEYYELAQSLDNMRKALEYN